MTTTAAHRSQWHAYSELWKITDTAKLTAAAHVALAPDCTYTDPNAHSKGIGEIVSYMNAFQQQMPGRYFVSTSFVDHHNQALASWNMVASDGAVVGTGTSFIRFDDSGTISSLTGFFDTSANS